MAIEKTVEASPVYCPFCGGDAIIGLDQWEAVSSEDRANTAELTEYQCTDLCGGRAFWV